jgi:NIMA (never in mitosis gene a)-related kinase
MNEDMIWGFFIQICQGLKSLHSANILHRDIKAQNIFLVTAREIKIGDLGVAKVTKGGMAYTQIGTPYYMSPEIWRRRPYNKKSDIWSLGCLLYELATLKHPFEARDERSLAEKVMRGVYAPIPSSYSSDLSTMVRIMLNVDPARRPTVDEILQHPIVLKRIESQAVKCGGPEAMQVPSKGLVETIRVPRQLSQLQNRLPGAKYERKESKQDRPSTARDDRSSCPSAVPSVAPSARRGPSVASSASDEENPRKLPGIKEVPPAKGPRSDRPYVPSAHRRALANRGNLER